MEYDRRLLREGFDIIVPLAATALVVDGTIQEMYEVVNKFPIGSHLGEIGAGVSIYLLYRFGLRGKLE